MADPFTTLAAAIGMPVNRVGFQVRVPQCLGVTPNEVRRWHWSKTRAAVARVRHDVALVLSPCRKPELPVLVTMIRCAPRKLDSDAVVGAMKNVRDEIAKWLGIDDADPRVDWVALQAKVARKMAGTVIRVEEKSA